MMHTFTNIFLNTTYIHYFSCEALVLCSLLFVGIIFIIDGGGGGGSSRIPMGGSNQQQYGMGPMVTRPFSSAHSTGSNSLTSLTPRVRDLGHGSAFNFSGGSTGSGGQSQRLNKRRRTEATPMAAHAMSPNTAFTLNQGNHSGNRGGQRWQPRDSGSFSRG
jgi:hypothetical protein